MNTATVNTQIATNFVKTSMQNLKFAAEAVDSDAAENFVEIAAMLLTQVAEIESMREFEKFTGLVFLKGQINAIDKMINRTCIKTTHTDQADTKNWNAMINLSDLWRTFFEDVDNY